MRSKVGIKRTFKFLLGRFRERQSKFWSIYDCFEQLELLIKTKKEEKNNFVEYDIHNILRLFYVSRNFLFTTGEIMRDYYL